ncbi:hypothetical protein HZS_2452, partial [Henneguya salminicola]
SYYKGLQVVYDVKETRRCETFAPWEFEDFYDTKDSEPDNYHVCPNAAYSVLMRCKCNDSNIIYEIPYQNDGCSVLNDPSNEYNNRRADKKFGRIKKWN